MLELLILGAVAAFIVTRLFQVLGQKSGVENVDAAKAMSRYLANDVFDLDDKESFEAPDLVLPAKLDAVVQKIKTIDSGFRVDFFLKGATQAFEMLIEAFAKQDLETLKILMSDEVFDSFAQAIANHQQKQQRLETTLVKFDPAEIIKMKLEKSTALITVQFTSEQVNIIRNHQGDIIEGNVNQIEDVIDQWVFARDVASENPNWCLVEIKK